MVSPILSLHRLEWCALALPLLLAACGGETGIVVEVRTDETVTVPIDKLVFVEGIALEDDPSDYQQDDLDGIVEADVSGRNLAEDGYRMMYRDGGGKGKPFLVAVIGKSGGQDVAFGAMAAPVGFKEGQVLEVEIVLSAGFNGRLLETGCLEYWTGDTKVVIHPDDDLDCDGSRACDSPDGLLCDCDDENWGVNPGAPEDCATTDIDENCNGDPMENVDADMDGAFTCEGDCNDADPDISPNAQESCDGVDNDCDGKCDDGFDFDGDTYTTCMTRILEDQTCTTVFEGDCDDFNAEVFEGHPEQCDGLDNDCNGVCDDAAGSPGGEPLDADGDGYTLCGTRPGDCLDPNPAIVDCEPAVAEVHPFATEACDGFDTNCDGAPLALMPCYETFDGACLVGVATCDDNLGDLHDCGATAGDNMAPAPDTLCASYDGCVASGSTNPFSCANDTADPVSTVTCTVRHNAFGALCPERFVPVFGDPAAAFCGWWILGGRFQAHYEVGLATEAAPTPADSIDACDGAFGVLVKRDLLPQADRVFLGYLDDLTGFDPSLTALVQVDLVPVEVASCTGVVGLECTIAIP